MGDVRDCDDICAWIRGEGVATHAAAGWAARRGNGQWELSVGGEREAFFDLASLTKPMTAFAVARAPLLAGPARALRQARLGSILAEAAGTPSENATLELLLAHRAGLEANLPLYRPLLEHRTVVLEQALQEAARARRADARGPIPHEGFAPLYSDLGYMVAGEALARGAGFADAGAAIESLVVAPLGCSAQLGTARALEALGERAAFRERVVPTEVVGWRGGEIRGRVHDENAFALRGDGGCGHAGMFGTVAGVLAFGTAALDAIARGRGPLATEDDLDWLVRPRHGGTLRAGFDGKTESGASTAGARCGPRTFGHLGFTGTSIWIDPDAEAIAVLLTNRVHPTRENALIRAARPRAHDDLFSLAADPLLT